MSIFSHEKQITKHLLQFQYESMNDSRVCLNVSFNLVKQNRKICNNICMCIYTACPTWSSEQAAFTHTAVNSICSGEAAPWCSRNLIFKRYFDWRWWWCRNQSFKSQPLQWKPASATTNDLIKKYSKVRATLVTLTLPNCSYNIFQPQLSKLRVQVLLDLRDNCVEKSCRGWDQINQTLTKPKLPFSSPLLNSQQIISLKWELLTEICLNQRSTLKLNHAFHTPI